MPLLQGGGDPANGENALVARVPEEAETVARRKEYGDDSMPNHEPHDDEAALVAPWRLVALVTGSLVLSLSGYVVGDTVTSIKDELNKIRAVLDSRAGLASRVESVERETLDQEHRLREIERRVWGSTH